MPHQFVAAAAILSLVALHQAVAQPMTPAVPDRGLSVVMRCQECGVVNAVREIQQPRQGTYPGVASESPVGLVVYIPFGRGASAGDSYAGSVGSREWQQRTNSTRYEFTVRMDDGDFRLVQKDGISDLQVGDRVKVSGGRIERWGQ